MIQFRHLVFCLLLAGLPATTAIAQTEPGPVAGFLKIAAELRHEAAVPRLLVLRREQPELVRPLIVLGRQAKASGDETPRDEDDIERCCRSLATRGEGLLAAAAKSAAELDRLLESSKDDSDRELLQALDRSLHQRIAVQAIERFEGRGAYRGMFRAIFSDRPRVARGFMDLFLDRLNDVGRRGYAAQGAAELADAGHRPIFAAEAASIWGQKDELPAIRRSALVLMKNCGRDAEFDREVAAEERVVATELAKERGKRSITTLIASYESLVDLLGRAEVADRALVHDEAYCRLLLAECDYDTQPPEARSGIAAALYDFSCRLSRAAALDAAQEVLDLALAWGFRDLAWVETDPELAALRGRPDFDEKIAAYRKGDGSTVRPRFDPRRWDERVATAVAAALKRMSAAGAVRR